MLGDPDISNVSYLNPWPRNLIRNRPEPSVQHWTRESVKMQTCPNSQVAVRICFIQKGSLAPTFRVHVLPSIALHRSHIWCWTNKGVSLHSSRETAVWSGGIGYNLLEVAHIFTVMRNKLQQLYWYGTILHLDLPSSHWCELQSMKLKWCLYSHKWQSLYWPASPWSQVWCCLKIRIFYQASLWSP